MLALRNPFAIVAAVREAIALDKRGIAVELATDHRASHYKFPAQAMHIIQSATLRGRDPISLAKTATLLSLGSAKAWLMLGRLAPRAVVGFGGGVEHEV